jgi:hypothetical protein
MGAYPPPPQYPPPGPPYGGDWKYQRQVLKQQARAQRSSQTGSISTRTPSISTSTDECPIHVTRSPLSGAVPYTATSVAKGPSPRCGTLSAWFVK